MRGAAREGLRPSNVAVLGTPAALAQIDADLGNGVSLPYKQRAFIMYDNDVTLTLT